jgi:hypothetical protein
MVRPWANTKPSVLTSDSSGEVLFLIIPRPSFEMDKAFCPGALAENVIISLVSRPTSFPMYVWPGKITSHTSRGRKVVLPTTTTGYDA